MILAKGMAVALALAVMAGFVGQAAAGLREYCDSYARDVANRKTNGGAGTTGGVSGGLVGHGNNVGSTVLGAGITSDRYKRVYTNAFERCVNNYQGGTRDASAGGQATDQNVTNKKTTAVETPEKKDAASSDVPDKTAASSGVAADDSAAASKPPDKKVASTSEVTTKKAASKATEKKVAANDAVNRDEACARKYRSYDPQVGKYKSLTGKWRPCRL
jgi:hypothetical protein